MRPLRVRTPLPNPSPARGEGLEVLDGIQPLSLGGVGCSDGLQPDPLAGLECSMVFSPSHLTGEGLGRG